MVFNTNSMCACVSVELLMAMLARLVNGPGLARQAPCTQSECRAWTQCVFRLLVHTSTRLQKCVVRLLAHVPVLRPRAQCDSRNLGHDTLAELLPYQIQNVCVKTQRLLASSIGV